MFREFLRLLRQRRTKKRIEVDWQETAKPESTNGYAGLKSQKAVVIMGPCTFKGFPQKNIPPCGCDEGLFVSGGGNNTSCQYCGHGVGDHSDIPEKALAHLTMGTYPGPATPPSHEFPVADRRYNRTILLDSEIELRTETTKRITERLKTIPVLHCRGTPTCGKTVLGKLLNNYLVRNTGYRVVHVTWQVATSIHRKGIAWEEFVCRREPDLDPARLLSTDNLVFIVDEAQLSYTDECLFWTAIKDQKKSQVGPKFVLLCSYGSASSHTVHIEGSAPVDLSGDHQIPLFKTKKNNLFLAFTETEFLLYTARVANTRGCVVSEEVARYIHTVSNGHCGLAVELLGGVMGTVEARTVMKKGGTIDMSVAAKFLFDRSQLRASVFSGIARSLPLMSDLRLPENEDLVEVLKLAVTDHGIEVSDGKATSGLIKAHKNGYLYAPSYDEKTGKTTFYFATEVHRWMIQGMLFDTSSSISKFESPIELCKAALEYFSPSSLKRHGRMVGEAPGSGRPEAQYCYELYSSVHKLLGGKVTLHAEFSFTTSGRIDFFLLDRNWGIEVLKDGDRLNEHVARCAPDGKYGSWGLVKQFAILDFRTEVPTKAHEETNLLFIIFDEAHEHLNVYDNDLVWLSGRTLLNEPV